MDGAHHIGFLTPGQKFGFHCIEAWLVVISDFRAIKAPNWRLAESAESVEASGEPSYSPTRSCDFGIGDLDGQDGEEWLETSSHGSKR